MGMLSFVCPTTGLEVLTGIDIDSDSFSRLHPSLTEVGCPHCKSPHFLAHVKPRLAGDSLSGSMSDSSLPSPLDREEIPVRLQGAGR